MSADTKLGKPCSCRARDPLPGPWHFERCDHYRQPPDRRTEASLTRVVRPALIDEDVPEALHRLLHRYPDLDLETIAFGTNVNVGGELVVTVRGLIGPAIPCRPEFLGAR